MVDPEFARLFNVKPQQDIMTGQIMFRKSGDSCPDASGRKLMMMFGVVAVPSDLVIIKDDIQYPIVAHSFENLNIKVGINEGAKLPEDFYPIGMSIAGLLTSPIWRV
jgi:hypothetical protein